MTDTSFTISDDFPPVDYATWRATVEADLKGVPFARKLVTHTYEDIDIEPVYTIEDWHKLTADGSTPDPSGFPGLAPFIRGNHPQGQVLCGVDLRQEHAHCDIAVTNKAILADLLGGVTSILLRFDNAAQQGLVDSDQSQALVTQDGVAIHDLNDLDAALAKVQLPLLTIGLQSGNSFIAAAAMQAALYKRHAIENDQVRGCWLADPLGTLADQGTWPLPAESMLAGLAELTQWSAKNYPNFTTIRVDTSTYHNAGATAAQDIGLAVATGVAYLRILVDAGMELDDAAKQIEFRMSVGTHHFLAIAKLRAARQLWARVLEACQASPCGMKLSTRTSDRVMTHRDPYVNLLRNSVAAFAGILGGADAVTSLPFDHAADLPEDFSRRIARNTVLILQEESHLHRVLDPAGGSWFLETLTRDVANKGWEVFQSVEKQGGMLAALQNGWVVESIDSAYAPRAKDIARRKEGITGVSEFPNLAEEQIEHQPPDRDAIRASVAAKTSEPIASIAIDGQIMDAAIAAAEAGNSIGQINGALGFQPGALTVEPTHPHAFAQPFEELRDASDAYQNANGHRPRVVLVNLGPVAHYTARATYSKNFFEAGGFEAIENDQVSDEASAKQALESADAHIAVICSSDKIYPEQVPTIAAALKQAGAQTVVLAGHPGEHEQTYSSAGVDRYIYMKCDVLGTLRELLIQEQVLPS